MTMTGPIRMPIAGDDTDVSVRNVTVALSGLDTVSREGSVAESERQQFAGYAPKSCSILVEFIALCSFSSCVDPI
jgi:hypothetical protein